MVVLTILIGTSHPIPILLPYPQATADPHNYSTTGALDMEFKRLVWGLLANLLAGQCPDIGPRVLASPLMEVLLMYIRR